jgi:metal-responsive CopG/Arc/MetJ family transcriptional regulator
MAKKNVALSIDEALLKRLNEYCDENDVVRSKLICRVIENELNYREKEKGKDIEKKTEN